MTTTYRAGYDYRYQRREIARRVGRRILGYLAWSVLMVLCGLGMGWIVAAAFGWGALS